MKIPDISNSDDAARSEPAPPMKYELHPACAMWPQMPDDEIEALAADIKANGLLEPLTLTPEGLLLDGRNRALACERAGVTPATSIHSGDPVLFSLSKNKHRRHMSVDQIAMVAATLESKPLGDQLHGLSNEIPSIAQIAEAAGVPVTAVASAKAVLRDGTPEEIAAVQTGNAKLRATADKVRAAAKEARRGSYRPRGAPKRETAKVFIKAYEAAQGKLPPETLISTEAGVSRGTAADVLRDVRARRADPGAAAPLQFTKAQAQHIEAAVARHRKDLSEAFDKAVRDGVRQGIAEALTRRDTDDAALIEKCREFFSRTSGRVRPPFTNDEYKLVLSALHPDAQVGDKRTEAFVLFKKKELLLRSTDEKDWNKI